MPKADLCTVQSKRMPDPYGQPALSDSRLRACTPPVSPAVCAATSIRPAGGHVTECFVSGPIASGEVALALNTS